MTFSYDGSEFSGYQKQPKGRTVRGELESVLKKINGDKLTKRLPVTVIPIKLVMRIFKLFLTTNLLLNA